MSTRRTITILVAAVAFTGLIAAPAQALPTAPTQSRSVADDDKSCVEKAPFDDPDDHASGLCPIPVLGITETSEERPPCDSCEHGGGTIVDAINKAGAAHKVGVRKHDTILGLANKKGNDASTLLTDPDALIAELAEHKAGDVLRLYCYSNEKGKYYVAKITLPAKF